MFSAMKVLSLALVAGLFAGAHTHHEKLTDTQINRTIDKLQPMLRATNIDIVHSCHEIKLLGVEVGDGGPSQTTAYSCYATEKPLLDALVEIDVKLAEKDRKLPEDLEKLLSLVAEDSTYFKQSLDESGE